MHQIDISWKTSSGSALDCVIIADCHLPRFEPVNCLNVLELVYVRVSLRSKILHKIPRRLWSHNATGFLKDSGMFDHTENPCRSTSCVQSSREEPLQRDMIAPMRRKACTICCSSRGVAIAAILLPCNFGRTNAVDHQCQRRPIAYTTHAPCVTPLLSR